MLCAYQLSLLPGQAFQGTVGVRESGGLAEPVAVCPDSGLHISLSVCLSSLLPHHPNPSSGYVQAAGLKSDPGGRRPFLLIRNRDTLPQSPPAQPDPHLSQAPMSWGHLLPLVTEG